MTFKDKVCVITGASSGIGRRTALDLAREGARVCVAARRRARLEEVVEEMGGRSRGHSMVVVDVRVKADVSALRAHLIASYARLDLLVNNAGVSTERPVHEPGALADFERIVHTNFLGAAYCTYELMPLLLRSAPSNVVNVASLAGRIAIGGAPAYCSSKFALVGLSEALFFQLRDKGVTVSVVEPGLIPTEGFPQTEVKRDRLLRYTLRSEEDVSKAIRDAVAHGKQERVVPRWYYLLQLPRLLSPPLYRLAERRLVAPRRARAARR